MEPARVDAVMKEAEALAMDASGSHRFTRHVKRLAQADREAVLESLFLVALADGEDCPFEEAYIRHVASLLHIDDVTRARAKRSAEARHAAMG